MGKGKKGTGGNGGAQMFRCYGDVNRSMRLESLQTGGGKERASEKKNAGKNKMHTFNESGAELNIKGCQKNQDPAF